MTQYVKPKRADSLVNEKGKLNKRKKVWQKVVMTLAVVVVFVTTYVLIMPALTANAEPHCGLEEHSHTEECYGDVLICGFETEGEGHAHTDECYEIISTLVCELEESEGHTHAEECCDEEGNLICELEESEGHKHTEECYATEKNLICELEESEGHTHTEECYAHELICGLTEHTHCTQCYSDFDADLENEISWTAAVKNAKFTGCWSDDIVSAARTQLGYTESEKNYLVSVSDDGSEMLKGYTRYGAWYRAQGYVRAENVAVTVDEATGELIETPDLRYMDWDTLFVSFCVRIPGGP